MFGLDEHLASASDGASLGLVLLVALLLGLRHATDPDHLTAVSTLVMGTGERGARRATVLGLTWGLGHATTLFALGLPIVLFESYLPDTAQSAAEVAIGVVIVVLAARLLLRWRRGALHSHPHEHDGMRHAHPHVHEHATGQHEHADRQAHAHAHADALGRTPLAAYGIGLIHGVGGSAGVGVLLIGAIADRTQAVLALVLFAVATAVAMAGVSSLFGHALERGPARRLEAMAPAFGTAGVLFGTWYALGAVGTVPYVF